MHYDKQCYTNQNTKNLPQHYNYSSNYTISSFKQAKCCNICALENIKKLEGDPIFVCQPVNRN